MSKKASTKKASTKKASTKKTVASPGKWQIVENVVAALERIKATVPGTRVEQKVLLPCLGDPLDSREIDVLVTIPASGRTLRIGLDVKDEGRALSTEGLGTLVEKRDETGLENYCVVTTAGFSAAAERKAKRKGVHLMHLEEFTVSDVWTGPLGHKVRRTEVGHVQFRFLFSAETLEECHDRLEATIARSTAENTALHDLGGGLTLRSWINGQLTQEAMTRLDGAADGDYIVPIMVATQTCTRLTVDGVDLPAPEEIECVIEATCATETLPEFRFRLGPIELSTVATELWGEQKQLTIAMVPSGDGGSKIVFAHGPATPARSPVTRVL